MDKNSSTTELFKRLESLHFLSSREMFLVLLELCLLKYLSKQEIREKYVDSYEIEDRFCFDNIAGGINYSLDSMYAINEARVAFANSGKTEQAQRILHLVFGATREIEAFYNVAIKNQRYASMFCDVVRNISAAKDVPDIMTICEYAALRMGKYGSSMSTGISRIISRLVTKDGPVTDIYDPIADNGFLVNMVCRDNHFTKRSLLFYNENDAVISLSTAILSGCSFDDISFELNGRLATSTLDSRKDDLVVANIPINLRLDTNDLIAYSHDNILSDCFRSGKPLFDTLVLKKVLSVLSDKGHAYLMIGGNPLVGRTQSADNFRSLLVDSGALKGIIKVPAGALTGTTVESYIIALDKQAEKTVFFVDSSDYFKRERAFADIDDQNAERLVEDIINAHGTVAVSIDDIKNDGNKLNVSFYTEMPKLKQIIEEGNCKKLCEIANILKPELLDGQDGKIINLEQLNGYPFNSEKMCIDGRSTVLLQKNDLIIHGRAQAPKVYYYQGCDQEVYAPKNSVVVRPTEIQPEYLAVYLGSEAAKNTLELVRSINRGGKSFLGTIYIDDDLIREMPVPQPSRKPEEYEERFNIENKYHIKYEDLLFYLNENNKKSEEKPTIDGILDEELLRNAPRFQKEIFEESMDRDINELKICYENGAYKAATILAGSILEAILIDWVSEIYRRNYFDEPFMVERNGREYEAGLADYISQIKFIKQPEWLKEADEAHHIRKMRNAVHAKVSISSVIDKEECNKVIKYLQDVLMSRRENS